MLLSLWMTARILYLENLRLLETAKVMSENLGYKTVLSGSVNKGKNDHHSRYR